MASRTSPSNRLQDCASTKTRTGSVKKISISMSRKHHQLTRHKPNTSSHLLIVVVEDERRSAADSGTPAESGIAVGSGIGAADNKMIADWRIGVWASGCILVVVGL